MTFAWSFHRDSLCHVDIECQSNVDRRSSDDLGWAVAHDVDQKKALGARLRFARKEAGYTLESAAKALTNSGFKSGKAAVGHWETGVNVPDALILRELSKMYGVSVDALLGLRVVMTTRVLDDEQTTPPIKRRSGESLNSASSSDRRVAK